MKIILSITKRTYLDLWSQKIDLSHFHDNDIISVEILGPPCHSAVMRKKNRCLFLNSRLTNNLRGRFQCRWFCDPGTVDRTVKNYTGPDTSVTHQTRSTCHMWKGHYIGVLKTQQQKKNIISNSKKEKEMLKKNLTLMSISEKIKKDDKTFSGETITGQNTHWLPLISKCFISKHHFDWDSMDKHINCTFYPPHSCKPQTVTSSLIQKKKKKKTSKANS